CLSALEGHSGEVTSVAFSHDSARIASALGDSTVKIWDTHSGAYLSTLEVGGVLRDISFDATGLYLHTAGGTISLSATQLAPITTTAASQTLKYNSLALSSDGLWITPDSEKLEWLLFKYRPSASVVLRKIIGIGARTRRVWIYTILA
ncbi:uncharacterized protein BDR25DRAFT_208897, partial [Lindgomyces ingoldianus]